MGWSRKIILQYTYEWFYNNDILKCNENKSASAERFIKTLKAEIYKINIAND